MNTEASPAQIARNVRQWRNEHAKRALPVEIRRKAAIGEEPSLNETELEVACVKQQAREFSNPLLP